MQAARQLTSPAETTPGPNQPGIHQDERQQDDDISNGELTRSHATGRYSIKKGCDCVSPVSHDRIGAPDIPAMPAVTAALPGYPDRLPRRSYATLSHYSTECGRWKCLQSRASQVWEMMALGDLQRPIQAQAGAKRSHRHLADVICRATAVGHPARRA
jgi:hypothetical protein